MNNWKSSNIKPIVGVPIEVVVHNCQGKEVVRKARFEENDKTIGWQVQGSAGLYWRYLAYEIIGWRYISTEHIENRMEVVGSM